MTTLVCECGCGETLDPKIARIFNLRAEGFGWTEIAERLGCTDTYPRRVVSKPPRFIRGHHVRRGPLRVEPPRVNGKVVKATVDGRYEVDASTDCWLWTGAVDAAGYGRLGRDVAHRRSYVQHVGPIPEGMTIDHLCSNRSCVNPAHLEVVTQGENVRRSREATKTHCVRGHEFTAENTGERPDRPAHRVCLACQKEYNLRRRRVRRDGPANLDDAA